MRFEWFVRIEQQIPFDLHQKIDPHHEWVYPWTVTLWKKRGDLHQKIPTSRYGYIHEWWRNTKNRWLVSENWPVSRYGYIHEQWRSKKDAVTCIRKLTRIAIWVHRYKYWLASYQGKKGRLWMVGYSEIAPIVPCIFSVMPFCGQFLHYRH